MALACAAFSLQTAPRAAVTNVSNISCLLMAMMINVFPVRLCALGVEEKSHYVTEGSGDKFL